MAKERFLVARPLIFTTFLKRDLFNYSEIWYCSIDEGVQKWLDFFWRILLGKIFEKCYTVRWKKNSLLMSKKLCLEIFSIYENSAWRNIQVAVNWNKNSFRLTYWWPMFPSCRYQSIDFKSNRCQTFFKIGVLKNLAIFIRKRVCWGLFLIKLEAWGPATLL